MTKTTRSRPVPPGKLAVFTAAAAPTLEETGMMDSMTFTVDGADGSSASEVEMERMQQGAHLTVPFQQEGPGGFSLVTVDFGPGYLLPRHSHSSDCLYYIVDGGIVMGRRELGPGDGFFLPANQAYAYHAGPQGVRLLEFRHETAFDMKVYEPDMARFREKAMSSLDEAEAGFGSAAE